MSVIASNRDGEAGQFVVQGYSVKKLRRIVLLCERKERKCAWMVERDLEVPSRA